MALFFFSLQFFIKSSDLKTKEVWMAQIKRTRDPSVEPIAEGQRIIEIMCHHWHIK